jgi:hypothetical protein
MRPRSRQIRRLQEPTAEVTKLAANQTQATANVLAQARPESSDFAKLTTWASRGTIQSAADDFAMMSHVPTAGRRARADAGDIGEAVSLRAPPVNTRSELVPAASGRAT